MTRWETGQAAGEAKAAAQRWHEHRAGCLTCSRPPARRVGVCVAGLALEGAMLTAQRVLEAHRELDAMPPEDQEKLF